MEFDQSAKQFENAFIMKFSAGRPHPHDIKLHIKLNWGLSAEPVVLLIDPRHVLIIPATYQDMVLAQAHEIHKIANCMFRLYRWTKIFCSAMITRRFLYGFASCASPLFTLIIRFCSGLVVRSGSSSK